MKMISDRNEAADKHVALAGKALQKEGHKSSEADLFNQEEDEAEQQAAKKRKLNQGEYTVTIQVLGKEIKVLMKGNRPGRSDLLVLLEPEMLESVFLALQRDAEECLAAKKRTYNKKTSENKD